MKLIPIAALLSLMILNVESQNLQHEPYPYPPQFQTASSVAFTSDKSLYLPPENHSPLPYFPIKKVNNLPFPYLPATGTKAPSVYPTPYPLIIASSKVPSFDDDDDNDGEMDNERIRLSSPQHPKQFQSQQQQQQQQQQPPQQQQQQQQQQYYNRTQNTQTSQQNERKEERMMSKSLPLPYRQPIDRADVKMPFHYGTMPTPVNQTPASRRHMIVTAEMTKEQAAYDQFKAASQPGLQFIHAPPGFVSSTTEPAVPILRLSNEMDLDGSFSYEALGADQTHYVQHSRMENMGSEKEEQVVEGSYSYVGDNGQTYTVHYIADSNGFRASGDHLPVPPPIPEIIQRSIQYNLAEESKRPPHLKSSWEEDSKEQNERPKNYNQLFNNPPVIPPPRNLFTGKQPEAFSYNYGLQGTETHVNVQNPNNNNNNNNMNNNNLVAAASNQTPVKTVDFVNDQTQVKPVNNGPIAPQITFLASQGAHVPSATTNQQTISRMFTNMEKSAMPQLMNYESIVKDNNEQENNKALWRWQYGNTANNAGPVKESISRSFAEGDDIMINFNDMTQEEYTNMIRSQLEPSQSFQATDNQAATYGLSEDKHNIKNYEVSSQNTQNTYVTETKPNIQVEPEQNTRPPLSYPPQEEKPPSSVTYLLQNTENNWYNDNFGPKNNDTVQQQQPLATTETHESRKLNSGQNSKLITQKHFLPQSQTVTQSYDYEEGFYDVRKIKSYKPETTKTYHQEVKEESSETKQDVSEQTISNVDNYWYNQRSVNIPSSTPQPTPKSSFKFTDFIVNVNSDSFKPIIDTSKEQTTEKQLTTTTTAISVENMFENNIFLKNMVRSNKNNAKHDNQITDNPKQNFHEKTIEPQQLPSLNKIVTDNQQSYNNFNQDPHTQNQQYYKKNEPQNNFMKSNSVEQQMYQNHNNQVTSDTQQMLNQFNSDTQKMYNKFNSGTPEHNHINAEPKTDKHPKFLHQNPSNDAKFMKMKPLDISDVINLVAMKNHFESSKVRPKSKPLPEFHQPKEMYYSSPADNQEEKENNNKHKINQEHAQSYNKPHSEQTQVLTPKKSLNQQQQEELRGIIKNYKVLQRNKQRPEQDNSMRKEQNSIPLRMMQMHSPSLPPLGRAGPTIKAYLPPIYV